MADTTEAKLELIATAFKRGMRTRGPIYLHLHAAITEAIDARVLLPGTRLPSEDQLARRLGLSVGTIRQAMQALSDDGLLERRQGAGTFVADPSIDMHDVWHLCFRADDGASFLPLKARAVRRGTTRAKGAWCRHMPDVGKFVTVRRLIDVGGEFQLLSDFYFDGERFGALAELPKAAFDRIVLRNLLAEHFGVRTLRATQHLRCARLEASDIKALKIADDSHGMILETFGHDTREHPIYYQRVIIPPSARALVIER